MSDPTIFNSFLITIGIGLLTLILGFIVCIINDVHKYNDLQKRLKKERERIAAKEKK